MIARRTADRRIILAILILLVGAASLFHFERIKSTCPLYNLVGIPCPFCKMTSAWSLTLHGDLRGGLTTNPFGVLFLALTLGGIVYLALALLFRLPPANLYGAITRRRWLAYAFFAVWLANWIYVIFRFAR